MDKRIVYIVENKKTGEFWKKYTYSYTKTAKDFTNILGRARIFESESKAKLAVSGNSKEFQDSVRIRPYKLFPEIEERVDIE